MSRVALILLFSLGCTLFLGGCRTSLEVAVAPSDKVAVGQVYYLPRTEVGIDLEREIRTCKVEPVGPGLAARWVGEQATALVGLSERFRILRLRSLSLTCKKHDEEVEESIGKELAAMLRAEVEPSGSCPQKSKDDLRKEYDQARMTLMERLVEDPWFLASDAKGLLEDEGFDVTNAAQVSSAKHVEDLAAAAAKVLAEDPEVRFVADLDVALRTTLTPYVLADMGHRYAIDYLGTKKGLKGTDYTVETYGNGTLKSVNVTLDDRTAQVIQSAVRGALTLAGGLSGFSLNLASAMDAAPDEAAHPQAAAIPKLRSFEDFRKSLKVPPLCKPEILDLLKERVALEKALGKLPSEIRTLEARLKKADDELKAANEALTKAKADGKTGDVLKPFEQAVTTKKAAKNSVDQALKAKQKQAEPFEARRTKIRNQLTLSSKTYLVPEAGTLPAQEPLAGDDKAINAWFDPKNLADYCNDKVLECDSGDSARPLAVLAYSAIYLSPSSPEPTATISEKKGVVYRQPATGLMMACARRQCLESDGKIQVQSGDLIVSQTLVIPQLGVLARLPLENGSFQNNNLQATFAENGVLTKVIYTSNARAEAAAAAFQGSASDIVAYLDARRGADAAQLNAEVAELTAEKNLVAAQLALEQERKKLEDFRAGLPVDSAGDDDGGDDDDNDGGAGDGDSGGDGDGA